MSNSEIWKIEQPGITAVPYKELDIGHEYAPNYGSYLSLLLPYEPYTTLGAQDIHTGDLLAAYIK